VLAGEFDDCKKQRVARGSSKSSSRRALRKRVVFSPVIKKADSRLHNILVNPNCSPVTQLVVSNSGSDGLCEAGNVDEFAN